MVHELELLMRRGFSVISIMVDPFGTASEPFDKVDVFLSVTHKDFSNMLRFLVRCTDFPHLCETTTQIAKMWDEKVGVVQYLSNNRVALNTLKYGIIYLQGTSQGIKFARDTLGLNINGQKQDKQA
jgi:hypothetical protein